MGQWIFLKPPLPQQSFPIKLEGLTSLQDARWFISNHNGINQVKKTIRFWVVDDKNAAICKYMFLITIDTSVARGSKRKHWDKETLVEEYKDLSTSRPGATTTLNSRQGRSRSNSIAATHCFCESHRQPNQTARRSGSYPKSGPPYGTHVKSRRCTSTWTRPKAPVLDTHALSKAMRRPQYSIFL